jgi:alpha-N-arabinofuranosidase
MRIDTTAPDEGLVNFGYFGIHVEAGSSYVATCYSKEAAATELASATIMAQLESLDGASSFGSTAFVLVGQNGSWSQLRARIHIDAGPLGRRSAPARFALRLAQPGNVLIASLGLIPFENVVAGHIFRLDLLALLQEMQPKFLRFPGGGYIDGCWPDEIWRWKKALGPPEGRPGHWNCWGYFTDDGLGPLEFLQLAQLLGAIPVWVLFDGDLACGGPHNACPAQLDVAHMVSAKQDILDALDFCMGNVSTKYGRQRAALLRAVGLNESTVFDCTTVALGNEECYNPPHGDSDQHQYVHHYTFMHEAIQQRWGEGNVVTINNCDCTPLSAQLPNDPLGSTTVQACRNTSAGSFAAGLRAITSRNIFELHSYEGAGQYIDWRHQFDVETGFSRSVNGLPIGKVFVSEYATKQGVGDGNLAGALAEAAYMTGLERNSDIVYMACYAPLFVHTHAREWTPDLIVFDSATSFGTPSYWVQRLFATNPGHQVLASSLSLDSAVAASAMCGRESQLENVNTCETLVLKLVNLKPVPISLNVSIRKRQQFRNNGEEEGRVTANVSVLTGGLDDHNSFADPRRVAPRETSLVLPLIVGNGSAVIQLTLEANSLTVARVAGVLDTKTKSGAIKLGNIT